MPNLILRPSGRPIPQEWVLQLRYHDILGPTEYVDIRHMSAEMAREILKAGEPFLLFKEPVP